MRVISDDAIFDNMIEFIEETQSEKGGVNVCEFVQKIPIQSGKLPDFEYLQVYWVHI